MTKRRYQLPPSSGSSSGVLSLKEPVTPSLRPFASITEARVPARMKMASSSSSPGVTMNRRPPRVPSDPAAKPAWPPAPSRASIHRRDPTRLKGTRASR